MYVRLIIMHCIIFTVHSFTSRKIIRLTNNGYKGLLIGVEESCDEQFTHQEARDIIEGIKVGKD